MFNPQMTSSQMELLPLVCLCLLSWSGTTSADPPVTVSVKQDDDVILPCSINANMETGVFEWKKDGQTEVFLYKAGRHYNNDRSGQDQHFKGRVSHFEDELKHGNASIKIRNAKMADSGNYTCVFPNNHPPPTFHVQLVVVPVLKDRTCENIAGAAPRPYIILDQTKNSALLLCEAHGVPDLEVHWQDSDGNILPAEESQVTERGGRKYIIVMTTVTKTGNFSCVATQKNINHEISSQIFVHLPEAKPLTDYTAGIIIGLVIALVVVVVVVVVLLLLVLLLGVLFYKKHKRDNEKMDKNIEGSSGRPAECHPLSSVKSSP